MSRPRRPPEQLVWRSRQVNQHYLPLRNRSTIVLLNAENKGATISRNTAGAISLNEQIAIIVAVRLGFDDIGLARFVALAISYAAFLRSMSVAPDPNSKQSDPFPPRLSLLVRIEITFYPLLCLAIFIWYCANMPFNAYLIDYLGLAFVYLIPVLGSLEECRKLWKVNRVT